jgi:hypothetical protein
VGTRVSDEFTASFFRVKMYPEDGSSELIQNLVTISRPARIHNQRSTALNLYSRSAQPVVRGPHVASEEVLNGVKIKYLFMTPTNAHLTH